MRREGFRQSLLNGESMMGTFMKTPSPIVAEVLGLSKLDVIAIDAEHAPFGRLDTDGCIAAYRAADMPCLVRVADDSTTQLRNALDSGADGVVVPHVMSSGQAERIVKACHFGDGGRGYAGSPRAAGYGTKAMPDYLADSAARTSVIVQVEDIPALEQVPQIAAVDGVDAVFIGRIDLAVAMGKGPMDEAVIDTVANICRACTEAGTTVGMFTPDLAELPRWRELGASLFLLSSDHSMMLAGANQLAESIR